MHLGFHRAGPHDVRSAQMQFYGLLVFTLLSLGGFWVTHARDDGPEPERLPAQKAAAFLTPGGKVFDLVKVAGAPTCSTSAADGTERLVFSKGAAAEGCAPRKGDLVVDVVDQRIRSFVPEWGRSEAVRGQAQMAEFHRRYGPY